MKRSWPTAQTTDPGQHTADDRSPIRRDRPRCPARQPRAARTAAPPSWTPPCSRWAAPGYDRLVGERSNVPPMRDDGELLVGAPTSAHVAAVRKR